jgi:hypothetical protein
MSVSSPQQPDRTFDRPEEVTDPLLWKLALEVADAHEPDGDGGCRNLVCAGQSWPCAAWNNAQHALRMAQAVPEEGSGSSVTDAARCSDHDGPLVGAPVSLVPAASRPAPPVASAQRDATPEAAVSAA